MNHWPLHARAWALLGPPLRPSPEDTRIVEEALADRRADVLVLGVTPELVTMKLAEGSTVVAVDRDPAMVEALFAPGPGRRALIGDWSALPMPDASVDAIVGDGCLSFFACPDGYGALARELARVLRPGGLVALRLFVSPARAETLDDVRRDLPRIGTFDALKWRVAMTLGRTVRVTDIRDAFHALCPDRSVLPFPRAAVDLIEHYRDSAAIYSFPTLEEARASLAPLRERACHVPAYELGERCPTLILVSAASRS